MSFDRQATLFRLGVVTLVADFSRDFGPQICVFYPFWRHVTPESLENWAVWGLWIRRNSRVFALPA